MSTPVITPAGGSFAAAAFPSSVTISGNGAPGGNYSALQYNITHSDNSSTGWTNYRGAVAITYGDTVLAQSARSNSAPYTTPSPTTQVYTLITSGTYVGASSAPTGPIFLDRMGWQIPESRYHQQHLRK